MTRETALLMLKLLDRMEAAVEAAESDEEAADVAAPFVAQLLALQTGGPWPVRLP